MGIYISIPNGHIYFYTVYVKFCNMYNIYPLDIVWYIYRVGPRNVDILCAGWLIMCLKQFVELFAIYSTLYVTSTFYILSAICDLTKYFVKHFPWVLRRTNFMLQKQFVDN